MQSWLRMGEGGGGGGGGRRPDFKSCNHVTVFLKLNGVTTLVELIRFSLGKRLVLRKRRSFKRTINVICVIIKDHYGLSHDKTMMEEVLNLGVIGVQTAIVS